MGKLTKWLKKIFRGSQSEESLPPAVPKISTDEIESRIENEVYKCLTREDWHLKFLENFNADLFYWQSVIKAICFAESNFNPRERFFEDSMGYYSEGLMQLSYEDCKAYGFPLDKSKDEIFDIEKNIQLGMIIMNRLIRNNGRFIFNDGNYWAVLKPRNKRHQVFLKKFKEYYPGGI